MALWYAVLAELSGRHYVDVGWEYSTGAPKEVLFSNFLKWGGITMSNLEEAKRRWGFTNFDHCSTITEVREELLNMRKICVFDGFHREIGLDIALAKIVDAIYDIHARGFPVSELVDTAMTLKQLPVLYSDNLGYIEGLANPFTPIYDEAADKLERFAGWKN